MTSTLFNQLDLWSTINCFCLSNVTELCFLWVIFIAMCGVYSTHSPQLLRCWINKQHNSKRSLYRSTWSRCSLIVGVTRGSTQVQLNYTRLDLTLLFLEENWHRKVYLFSVIHLFLLSYIGKAFKRYTYLLHYIQQSASSMAWMSSLAVSVIKVGVR